MFIDEFREYCLGLKGVDESFPFGPDSLVFKVMGKMFAVTDITKDEFEVNLKCDPDRAIRLRESYTEIRPGYHMNKKHWNTISFLGNLSDDFLIELIDHSYHLVVAKLPRKDKDVLDAL